MSDLKDNPALCLEVLAKLVKKMGGYAAVTTSDEPTGPFNLLTRYDPDTERLELKLDDGSGTA